MPILLRSMWKHVDVTLKFRRRVVGGIPNTKELILGWLQANMGMNTTEEQRLALANKTLQEIAVKGEVSENEEEPVKKASEVVADQMATVFKQDEKGLYLEGRCVKSMFKEAASVLRELLTKDEAEMARMGKKQDEKKAKAKEASEALSEALEDDPNKKNGKKIKAEPKTKSRFTGLKARTAEQMFVEQDRVYLMRNGHIKKSDGVEERAIHVTGPQGPRTALKRFHFVNEPTIQFTCRYLREGVVDKELIETFLEYAGWNGLGADRSQGEGMFDVMIITEE